MNQSYIFRAYFTKLKNYHLICRFEAGVGDFRNGQLFMVSFFGRNDGRIGDQGEVNSWVWDQISLKFGQINIEGAIKAKRCSNGRDNLTNNSV